MLCALTAIEEPHLSSLRQPQSHTRNISRAGRHPGAGSQKSYLQGLNPYHTKRQLNNALPPARINKSRSPRMKRD